MDSPSAEGYRPFRSTQREYIWMGDLPVAAVEAVAIAPVIYYVHTDRLGRPVAMAQVDQSLAGSAIYKPFGEVQAITTPNTTMDLRFRGQWFQLETGLHYNGHRHFDATTGRSLQPDPLGFVCVSSSISLPKDLEPGKWVKIERWGDAEEARRMVSGSIERLRDRRLDEAAHLRAKVRLDQIEPIAEQLHIGDIARRLRGISVPGAILMPPSNSDHVRHGTLSVVRVRGASSACGTRLDVFENSDRQSRRNRVQDHPDRAASWDCERSRLFGRRSRGDARRVSR